MENDRIWILLTRKLSGEASSTELRELDALVTADPGSEKLVAAVTDTWIAGSPTDTEFLEATYLQHLERMKDKGFSIDDDQPLLGVAPTFNREPKKAKFYRNEIFLSVAVILLAAASLLIIKKPVTPSAVPPPADGIGVVSTNNGSRTKLLLPDGSGVWLNAGSKLSYSKKMDGKLREVELEGEAFFDIVKDLARPFIIHTSKMDVKVLGTRFNVKAYEQDKTLETSLINGSVEIRLKNAPLKKYTLKPNQKLVLGGDEPANLTTTAAERTQEEDKVELKELTYLEGSTADVESSWTRNILSFEDEPFLEVSKKMERWYDVTFEFKNKRWENEFLRGSFEKESLEQAMTALKFTTGFNFSIKDKIISIY